MKIIAESDSDKWINILKNISKFRFSKQLLCLFKVNNGATAKMCEICLKLKTSGQRFRVFIDNFEHILHLFQCFSQ